MKEKLKSLLPQFAVALAGGVLPLLMALVWQQNLNGRMFGTAVFSILYLGVIFLLLSDGFYRLFQGKFRKSVLWAGAMSLVAVAISLGAYLFATHVFGMGSLIRMVVFGVAVVVCTVFVYGFALVLALLSTDWIGRAFVSGVALVAVLALVLPLTLNPIKYFEGYRGDRIKYGTSDEKEFSVNDPFILTDGVILEKDPEKDFVVLNLADIQLTDSDFSPLTPVAVETFLYIKELIERTNPSLITVSGDTGCGYETSTRIIAEFIDSFEIPWAPVFGNHDHEIHDIDANYAAEIFMEQEHCVFQKGPANLGVGNYMIHVMEEGKLIHTFFMMDSHSYATFKVDGEKVEGYDHFWADTNGQLDWYYWGVTGITAHDNRTVPSTVIAHIPLVQFEEAFQNAWDFDEAPDYKNYEDYKNGCYKYDTAFGVYWDSGVASSPVDNGFFELMLALGSTEHFLVGHDHTNNFSVMYQGIRLTYALKTGAGCYWNEKLNGGTTVTLASDGHTTVEHHYVQDK